MARPTDTETSPIDAVHQDGSPDPDAIIAQLDRVLSSTDFVNSGRLCSFLKFIVEETLAGRASHLKEYVIGVDVYERGESFDPQTSSIVRVEAGRLRSRLEKYNAVDGRDDPIHISLPPGGYVPVFETNTIRSGGTMSSRIKTWLESKTAFGSKKFTAFLLILAVVIGIATLHFFSPHAPKKETGPPPISASSEQHNSVAILPLRNLSGDVNQDYFSDGITDALIAALAEKLRMRVISTRSVLAYKNADKPVASIAKELSVSHIVEGAVLRFGDKVRITAQLIEAKTDRHLWAETFERVITDPLAIQNDIVRRIVTSLVLKVADDAARAPTATPQLRPAAYEAQLKGRFFRNKMTEEGLRKGLQFFKEAIAKQPDYALAYSGMAACYCLLGGHGFELIKPSEALPVAKKAALEALSLNNSLAEPHAFLGIIRLKYEWDWKGAESEFRQSIALNPSYVQARLFYSYFLEAMGRKKEAIREAQEARAIDPLSLEANINLGWQNLQAGQLEEAHRHFERTAELSPDFWGVHWGIGHYHRRKGNFGAAIESFEKAINSGGGHALPLTGLGYTYAISGKPGKALEMVAKLNDLSQRSYVSPFNVATIYAGLDEKELVFAWLEKAFVHRSRSLAWLNVLPEFDKLRTDQRFKSLLRRVGLPG